MVAKLRAQPLLIPPATRCAKTFALVERWSARIHQEAGGLTQIESLRAPLAIVAADVGLAVYLRGSCGAGFLSRTTWRSRASRASH